MRLCDLRANSYRSLLDANIDVGAFNLKLEKGRHRRNCWRRPAAKAGGGLAKGTRPCR